jgi:Na+-driven multidrug efflux pump
MGLELPLVAAVMARLPRPEISLAAYGGVVFPLSLLIEGPVIMLLAASTALSRDHASYRLIRRVMNQMGAALTIVHAAVAFTPLYDLVVGRLIGAPEEILEPARWGLMLMTPWTWSIAYRRFQQGVLIAFGQSSAVGIGTVVRLAANILVLGLGFGIGRLPGIVVGCLAVVVGVMAEAAFVGWWVQPLLRDRLRHAPSVPVPLTLRRFVSFYVPLALTPLITLAGQPMAAAAISRMPQAVDSLAVLPVLGGLVFLLRSLGFAYNEVVVSLLDEPGALRRLGRFALGLGLATSLTLVVMTLTPLGQAYFERLSALEPDLVQLAGQALWIALALPALAVAMHFYQGILVHAHRTMPVTEAVVLNLMGIVLVLAAGIGYGRITGIYVGLAAFTVGNLAQSTWLWLRSRTERRRLAER